MKRRFVYWAVFGIAAASGISACGYRRSVPVNAGARETLHGYRYLIDMGRVPAAGSRFHVTMMSDTTALTQADVDGELKKRSEEKTAIAIEVDADVLAATVKGISKARYTIHKLVVDGSDVLPLETVVTFDRDAAQVLTIGEDAVPPRAVPALMVLVTGLEPLNDDALIGLVQRKGLGTTWKIDALAAAVEFEKSGISVDPHEIKGRSHFAKLTELEGIPSMTIQSELHLEGARPKRPVAGLEALPGTYNVKSEITVPLRVGDATLRDERLRTHSVVQVRTAKHSLEPEVLLTLTTTNNQALRMRPIGDGGDAGSVRGDDTQDVGAVAAAGAAGGEIVPGGAVAPNGAAASDGALPPGDDAPPQEPAQSPDTGWGPESDDPPEPEPIWDPSRTGPPGAPNL